MIEGPKAGGHLGFSREQLEEYAEYDDKEYAEKSYDDEVKKIMAVVRKYGEKYGCSIPVVLAGGIYDRAAAKHAFSLGVDGIQVATRFVTTEECDADIRYKEAYIRANKEDIQIVKSPVGMPGRAIMNSFMERGKDITEEVPALHEGLQAFGNSVLHYGVSAPCGKG